MSEQEIVEFEQRIVTGVNKAFQRLVNEKKKVNEELVIANNGQIFRVKAADFHKMF